MAEEAAPVVESVSANRTAFLKGSSQNIQGCLLIPTGSGFPPTYLDVCSDSMTNLMGFIKNSLTTNKYEDIPDRLQPVLLGLTPVDDVAEFNSDTDTKLYFKLVVKPETTVTKNGATVTMLDALRSTFSKHTVVKANTMPFLTSLGQRLLKWVYDKKLSLAVAVMVLGIVYILLSDDPSSYLPKDVHRYFSTNSNAKKLVDAGKYWNKNFGADRPEEGPIEKREEEEPMFKEERKQFDRDPLFARALGKPSKPKLEGLAALQELAL